MQRRALFTLRVCVLWGSGVPASTRDLESSFPAAKVHSTSTPRTVCGLWSLRSTGLSAGCRRNLRGQGWAHRHGAACGSGTGRREDSKGGVLAPPAPADKPFSPFLRVSLRCPPCPSLLPVVHVSTVTSPQLGHLDPGWLGSALGRCGLRPGCGPGDRASIAPHPIGWPDAIAVR